MLNHHTFPLLSVTDHLETTETIHNKKIKKIYLIILNILCIFAQCTAWDSSKP